MDKNRTSLEIIAPTVEEAIERGLADLGMVASDVEVEILDAGSKGLFGLGIRQARIRLTIKPTREELPLDQPVTEAVELKPGAEPVEQPYAATSTSPVDSEDNLALSRDLNEAAVEQIELDENLLDVARETVRELLDKMKIPAQISARFGEPDEPKNRPPLLVDIRGEDLSILIGPRAETLNALQYIAGLIVGKEVGHSVPLVVDVEGFRMRRSQQIRQLARRMAEQAVRTGRRQVLEPMPASERRLIHIELREHSEVTTESIGEEPRRKVTIIPK